MGDIHVLGNPHYWLDPENAKASAAGIAEGLKAVDPADAAFFEANLKAFAETLTQQEERWEKLMEPYQGTKVITYHNSWPYFARRFGLNVVGYVEPKPGIPPPPSHVAELIEQVKRDGIKLIIIEPYFSEKIPQLVASQTGCRVLVLPPSVGGVKGVDDYAALLDYDINQITSALKGQGTP
jgi:ABC-type Zn uptake system ZnuABC Zn-binding protein ZnuA